MTCDYCGDPVDPEDVCRTCHACEDCCDCDVESFDSDEFGEDPEAEFERRFQT